MDSIVRLFAFFFICGATWADLNPYICSRFLNSYGPIPPALPANFELKGQFVDEVNKVLGYTELYYDFDNLRGKYMMLSQGIEFHLLFDYNVSQVLSYYVMHSGDNIKQDPLTFLCSSEAIEYSKYRNIFGYRYGVHGTKNSRMYDSNHVLRFGGPYQFVFNGSSYAEDYIDGTDQTIDDTSDDRGLPFRAFIGCVYENDFDTTSLMRYKFSGYTMMPAGGSVQGDVDGSEDISLLSVPISLSVQGTATFKNPTSGNKTQVYYDRRNSFSWFKANPVFDNRNLQIPPWMHCDGYRGWKSMPKLPLEFSVRVETTIFAQDIMGKIVAAGLISVDELYYYNEKGLARRDYTPHIEKDKEIFEKFGTLSPVKTVYDFTTTLLYVINKASGRCFTRYITKDDYFDKKKDSVFTEMALPDELFFMEQEDMEYKGQYFTRDIECDVWSGKFYDEKLQLDYFKETYITTNGWHSDADEKVEYSVPIKHTLLVNSKVGEFQRTVSELNFFKFKAYAPVLATFDISECVETIEHKFFAIRLLVPNNETEDVLNRYRFLFLEAAQYYLATVSDLVSPLRIQRINLRISKSGTLLTFAMVEKPQEGILNPVKGATVEEASDRLRTVVNEGNFEIIFYNPGKGEKMGIGANKGDFFEWIPGGNLTIATKITKPSQKTYGKEKQDEHRVSEHVVKEKHPRWFDVTATVAPPKKKMSPGALAGLSIGMLIIGIAIGISVMYLYIRKYGDQKVDDYAMHTTG